MFWTYCYGLRKCYNASYYRFYYRFLRREIKYCYSPTPTIFKVSFSFTGKFTCVSTDCLLKLMQFLRNFPWKTMHRQLLTSITDSSIIEIPFSNSTIYLNKVLVERVLESSKSREFDVSFLFLYVWVQRVEWARDGWTWVNFLLFPDGRSFNEFQLIRKFEILFLLQGAQSMF